MYVKIEVLSPSSNMIGPQQFRYRIEYWYDGQVITSIESTDLFVVTKEIVHRCKLMMHLAKGRTI